MDVIITVKLATHEYDLLRRSVRSHFNTLTEERQATTDLRRKEILRDELAQLHALEQKF